MPDTTVTLGPSVGSRAPDLVVSGVERRAHQGEPRVLAFVHDAELERECAEAAELTAIRAELRGLGAELVVVSAAGVWSVRADDPIAPRNDLAGEIGDAAMRYGIDPNDDAVFVID